VSEKAFRVEVPVNFNRRQPKSVRQAAADHEPDDIPRTVRLLALAHKWERMVRRGETDYAELARRHGLSSARVSQICLLTLLAPENQQSVLLASSLSQRCLAAMAAHPIWREQRCL